MSKHIRSRVRVVVKGDSDIAEFWLDDKVLAVDMLTKSAAEIDRIVNVVATQLTMTECHGHGWDTSKPSDMAKFGKRFNFVHPRITNALFDKLWNEWK